MFEKIMDNLMEIILTAFVVLVDVVIVVVLVFMFTANPAPVYEYILTGVMGLGLLLCETFMLLYIWGW